MLHLSQAISLKKVFYLQTLNDRKLKKGYYKLFYKQRPFSTHPQCCLTFAFIEIQMLLRCCLIDLNIIILRSILYLPYLSPCLTLGLLMSCLCHPCNIFIFSLNFIVIDRITSLKQTHLFFVYTFFRKSPFIFGSITSVEKANSFLIVKVQPQGVAQLFFDFFLISVWHWLLKCRL